MCVSPISVANHAQRSSPPDLVKCSSTQHHVAKQEHHSSPRPSTLPKPGRISDSFLPPPLILSTLCSARAHTHTWGGASSTHQHGQPSPDLHTPPRSSCLANIRVAFGPALSRELVELECSQAEELLDQGADGGGEKTRRRFRGGRRLLPLLLL